MIRSFPKNYWRKPEHGSPALPRREGARLVDEVRESCHGPQCGDRLIYVSDGSDMVESRKPIV
jgi:hypothetical protein